MKTTLIILSLCLSTFFISISKASAQTKEETIEWLRSKFSIMGIAEPTFKSYPGKL